VHFKGTINSSYKFYLALKKNIYPSNASQKPTIAGYGFFYMYMYNIHQVHLKSTTKAGYEKRKFT